MTPASMKGLRQHQKSTETPEVLRIAIVLPHLLPWGGAERMAIALIKQFLALNFAVDLVLLGPSQDLRDVVPENVRVFNLQAPRLRHSVWPLIRYLREERPDAIIGNMWALTVVVLIAHRIARSDARVIVIDHSVLSIQYAHYGFFYRLGMRVALAITYPWADARVMVSTAVAEDVARLSGVARDRFTVILNPLSFDIDGHSDASNAESTWLGWRGKRILTVGRLKAAKNHALLIRAFKRLIKRQDARLMIVGDGELAEETAALVQSEGLQEKVIMPGGVKNPMAFYQSADLFVLSSDREGCPLVIVEALACGLPVVTTDCPGTAEILEHGRYGLLVPVGDEDALEAAMAAALSEEPDSEALKARAADFAPSVVAGKYLSLMFPGL